MIKKINHFDGLEDNSDFKLTKLTVPGACNTQVAKKKVPLATNLMELDG